MITKFNSFILENLQLSDKLYFKNGKLSEDEKRFILSITNGDVYTKAICDSYIYINEKTFTRKEKIKEKIIDVYNQLKNYNKNVFPIKNFDIYNIDYNTLKIREKLLKELEILPSIAIRNLKNEIRQERTYYELEKYENDLEYFTVYFSLLGNRDIKMIDKIHKKMFKSNTTLDKLLRFVEDKENLLGGKELTKEYIKNLVKENEYDLEIIYDNGNIMVVDVLSLEGVKEIGCNSLWCFTYGNYNFSDWNTYSYNGHVYVIIDFSNKSDEKDFMHVLIAPLKKSYKEDDSDSPLYDMSNQQSYAPIEELKIIFGKFNFRKLFTFGY